MTPPAVRHVCGFVNPSGGAFLRPRRGAGPLGVSRCGVWGAPGAFPGAGARMGLSGGSEEVSDVLKSGTPKPPRRLPAILRPMVPSSSLAKVVGDEALPRPAIVKRLSSYVKSHGLQDPVNATRINADSTLKNLLGVDSCTFLELSKLISPHLKKVNDVGGKYVQQAQKFEQEWIAKKEQESEAEPSTPQDRLQKARREKTGVFAPVVLSPELSAICQGKKELPRQECVKAVWHYIRLNNLKTKNGVRPDFLLRRVFGSNMLTIRDIMIGVSRHVSKKP